MRYLLATVTTDYGPARFPVAAGDDENDTRAVWRECQRRGVAVRQTDKIELLTPAEYAELWGGRPPAHEEARHYRYVYSYHPEGQPGLLLTDSFVSNEQLTAAKAWSQAVGAVGALPGWHTVVKVSEVLTVEIDTELKKPG